MRTSVVTVNYKGAEDTAACVASLLKSNSPVSVIVVDNTPNDPELAAALSPFPEVKVLQAPENLGFGKGNNIGIEWALCNTRCEYIFILNNDATVDPDTIGRLEMSLDEHLDAAIVTAKIVMAEDTNCLWYGGGEVDWRKGGGKVEGWMGPSDAPYASSSRYVTFASGCAMMIRRNMLREFGGFDSRFFMYEEDVELCLRYQAAGWRIWYESDAIISHLGQGSLRKTGHKFAGLLSPLNPNLAFYVFHVLRNRMINMSIYAHGRNKLVFSIFFPLFMTKLCLRYLLSRRFDGLKAMWSAYRSSREVIKPSRSIEKTC